MILAWKIRCSERFAPHHKQHIVLLVRDSICCIKIIFQCLSGKTRGTVQKLLAIYLYFDLLSTPLPMFQRKKICWVTHKGHLNSYLCMYAVYYYRDRLLYIIHYRYRATTHRHTITSFSISVRASLVGRSFSA